MPTKEAIWVLGLLEEAIELRGVPHELMVLAASYDACMTDR